MPTPSRPVERQGTPASLERFLQHRDLAPAARGLEALGRQWARDCGADWSTVLNDGPLPPSGPSWPFRWGVVARALEAAAGVGAPVADFSALPLGLQAFLRFAIPAALHPAQPVEPDLPTAARVLAEAEQLAAELVPATAPGHRADPPPRAVPPPGPEDDPATLLGAALQPSSQPTSLPGLEAIAAALAGGPLPVARARELAATHGVLLGTLLDALDRASLRQTGRPAVRVEADIIYAATVGAPTGRPPADA